MFWRDPVYTDEDEPQLAGEVSSNDQHYNIHQYGDILRYLGKGAEQRDVDVSGEVSVSDSRHRMTGRMNLGEEFEPVDGDTYELQIRFGSGHSGFFKTEYDVGAIRQICENGMRGFVADQTYEQTHQEPLKPQLAFHAVDSIVDGVDQVEDRIAKAAEEELMNFDEALLTLMDYNIDSYFPEDEATSTLRQALGAEVEDPDNPTLKETYDAATRAITHDADLPDYAEADALERAARLLDQHGQLPEGEEIGRQVVSNRANQLIENQDAEPYFDHEEESLRELMEEHEIEA